MCVSFPNPGEVKVYNEKNREKVWEFDEVRLSYSYLEMIFYSI